MKNRKSIIHLLAACLLIGAMLSFGFDLYAACEFPEGKEIDIELLKVDQLNAPISNLFNRQTSETETESGGRTCLQQFALPYLVYELLLTEAPLVIGYEQNIIGKPHPIFSQDVIVRHHQFLI